MYLRQVRIVFEDTFAKLIGPQLLEGLPGLQAPQLPEFLKPPRNFRAATFEVTFLDETMRVCTSDHCLAGRGGGTGGPVRV